MTLRTAPAGMFALRECVIRGNGRRKSVRIHRAYLARQAPVQAPYWGTDGPAAADTKAVLQSDTPPQGTTLVVVGAAHCFRAHVCTVADAHYRRVPLSHTSLALPSPRANYRSATRAMATDRDRQPVTGAVDEAVLLRRRKVEGQADGHLRVLQRETQTRQSSRQDRDEQGHTARVRCMSTRGAHGGAESQFKQCCQISGRELQREGGVERHNAGAVVCLLNELEHLDGRVGRILDMEVAALAQDPGDS